MVENELHHVDELRFNACYSLYLILLLGILHSSIFFNLLASSHPNAHFSLHNASLYPYLSST
jgi:hypothetical protein